MAQLAATEAANARDPWSIPIEQKIEHLLARVSLQIWPPSASRI
jgi:hypothetical protein